MKVGDMLGDSSAPSIMKPCTMFSDSLDKEESGWVVHNVQHDVLQPLLEGTDEHGRRPRRVNGCGLLPAALTHIGGNVGRLQRSQVLDLRGVVVNVIIREVVLAVVQDEGVVPAGVQVLGLRVGQDTEVSVVPGSHAIWTGFHALHHPCCGRGVDGSRVSINEGCQGGELLRGPGSPEGEVLRPERLVEVPRVSI